MISDDDKAEARENIMEAIELTGGLYCHDCGTTRKGKIQVRRSKKGPYVKCWKCGWHPDAITLMQEEGYSFSQAVNILCGRNPYADEDDWKPQPSVRKAPRVVIPESFKATLDVRTYSMFTDLATPGIGDAAPLWAQHGIDPAVARDYGCTFVSDATALGNHLDRTIGHEAAVAAGLTTTGGKWIFAGDYTLIEAHTAPSGMVFGMQFRATGEAARAAKEHKRTKGTPEATKFVPHVLALRGGTPKHLIGCGLNRIARAEPGVVHIVEGYKDMLAAATLGMMSYALPGASTQPPDVATAVLSKHRIVVSLDADDAGRAGAQHLAEWFAERNIPTTQEFPAEGCDWADMLTAPQQLAS